jgi:hypothetical protein
MMLAGERLFTLHPFDKTRSPNSRFRAALRCAVGQSVALTRFISDLSLSFGNDIAGRELGSRRSVERTSSSWARGGR